MLVELDNKLSTQVDEILHAPKFQEIEASWRSLKLLVDRTDFRENIKINILHATKEELLEDFEFSPEIVQSGFYQHVYSSGYGQFGGEEALKFLKLWIHQILLLFEFSKHQSY